jgi:hypothetical protein
MVKPCGYQITKDGYSDNIRMNEKDKLLFMFAPVLPADDDMCVHVIPVGSLPLKMDLSL